MDEPALFNPDPYDQEREPLNPRAVACPTCGALVGRPCKRPSGHRAMIAHAGRIAQARFAAGLADEPTPRLPL